MLRVGHPLCIVSSGLQRSPGPSSEISGTSWRAQLHKHQLSSEVTDIPKFEHQNPGLSVNTFGWKGGLYPLHVSKREGRETDLLLINDRKEPEKKHTMSGSRTWPACYTKTAATKSASTHAPLSTHLLHRKAARRPQK